MIIVYAFFFASTNLFYHSHLIADIKIVHSHPWSSNNHSHNTSQLTFISFLDSEIFQDATSIEAPEATLTQIFIADEVCPEDFIISRNVLTISLRAPPSCC